MNKDAVKDKRILIVDDVMTTGSTGSELAKVLIKASAKKRIFAYFCKHKI